jgi:Mg2+ and Co2+ transporter CorA
MSEQTLLPTDWDVPVSFRERLGTGIGRQRLMAADQQLLLVLHAPPEPNDKTRKGRLFWRDVLGEWSSSEPSEGIQTIQSHLDNYEAIIDELDRLEDAATTADRYFQILERLMPLERSSIHLYEVLQEARKECSECREIIDFRDRAYVIKRTAELLLAATRNSMKLIVVKRSEEHAEASYKMTVAAHRLNILAAFFFPIITVTAILGLDMPRVLQIVGVQLAPDTAQVVPLMFIVLVLCCMGIGWQLMRIINRPPRKR